MAYVAMSFRKTWPKNRMGGDAWVVLEEWVIEDPYSRRRCAMQGCKRLIGHPERQVDKNMHADFDVSLPFEDRPGTFSMWPIKKSTWGTPTEGAIRGVTWP